jgi:hypothetical protein
MKSIHRYLGILLLGAAILAPTMLIAGPNPQDRAEQREEQRERQRRYYDREHRDYHAWNSREDVRYREWRAERHYRAHVRYERMKRRQQADYWRWRHSHPDHD